MRKKKVLSSSDLIAVPAYWRSSAVACLYTPDITKMVLPPVHQVVKHSIWQGSHSVGVLAINGTSFL